MCVGVKGAALPWGEEEASQGLGRHRGSPLRSQVRKQGRWGSAAKNRGKVGPRARAKANKQNRGGNTEKAGQSGPALQGVPVQRGAERAARFRKELGVARGSLRRVVQRRRVGDVGVGSLRPGNLDTEQQTKKGGSADPARLGRSGLEAAGHGGGDGQSGIAARADACETS